MNAVGKILDGRVMSKQEDKTREGGPSKRREV